MAVILGPTYQEQPLSYRLHRIDGTSYTRTWLGPKAELDAIAAVEKIFAESVDLTGGPTTYTLVCRYITAVGSSGSDEDDISSETHDFDTDTISQSIFLNETFQVLTAEEQVLIRKVYENKETYSDAMDVLTVGVAGGRLAIAIKAYDLLIMGTENFDNYAFRLTRNRNASRKYTGQINMAKIGSVWSTAELAAEIGNPLLFAVPDLALTTEESTKNLYAGWRQTVCRVSDIANGSRQMTEQWVLAKWSLDLYVRQNTIP